MASNPSHDDDVLAMSALLEAKTEQTYEFKKHENYIAIKLIGNPGQESAAAFEAAIKTEIDISPALPVVVNCEQLESLSKIWIRALLILCRLVKASGKDLRFILVNPVLAKAIADEGMDSMFKQAPSIREAMVELGLVKEGALDVNFINPFLKATMNAFEVQVGTLAKPQKLQLKPDRTKSMGDISGVIGIVSASFSGSVVLALPLQTALNVVGKMLGETFTSITPEVVSGAAELTNIVFGGAKTALNERGYALKTALPSVVSGGNHIVFSATTGPVVIVPFETELGPFFVEICLSG